MSEFEFLRNVTIGQYLPAGSAIHRLDPRVKLVIAALFVGGAIATTSLVALFTHHSDDSRYAQSDGT